MTNLVRKMDQDILAQVTIYGLDGMPVASTYAPPPLTLDEVQSVILKQTTVSLRRDGESQRSLTFSHINYAEVLGTWKLRGYDAGLIGTAIPKNFLVQTSSITFRVSPTLCGPTSPVATAQQPHTHPRDTWLTYGKWEHEHQ